MVRSYLLAAWRGASPASLVRAFGCLCLLAAVSACAGHAPVNQAKEAEVYEAHAARSYKVPGTMSDPWGPYVIEASQRFDVPTQWIREVMRAESGGLLYHNGELVTSGVGAMGLMQVMPETYDGLHDRYSLGDDAYDPHNNILAGTAYIREMYDIYGSPGFLAAYNAGPGRLDDYLSHNKGLPDETRHYVAKIGPNIAGIWPNNRSPAEDLAINQLPIDIPAGPRYGRPAHWYASNTNHNGSKTQRRGEVEVAEAPPRGRSPSRGNLALPPEEPRVQTAMATSHNSAGFHLISPAAADTLPSRKGGPSNGNWAIQVGAYGNASQAKSAADSARGQAREAHAEVGTVKQTHATLYRARLTGMSRDAAVQACERLSKGKGNCIVLSPASQS